MKNSCSGDLVSPDWHTKDFSPIWLNTVMDALIIPRDEALSKKRLLIIENENHANFRADSSRADSSTTFDPQGECWLYLYMRCPINA